MYLLTKSGDHGFYRSGDINSYINSYLGTSEKAEVTAASIGLDWEIFKISNTNLQSRSPRYGWQKKKEKKKKKNTGNCKALCVSSKRNKTHVFLEN